MATRLERHCHQPLRELTFHVLFGPSMAMPTGELPCRNGPVSTRCRSLALNGNASRKGVHPCSARIMAPSRSPQSLSLQKGRLPRSTDLSRCTREVAPVLTLRGTLRAARQARHYRCWSRMRRRPSMAEPPEREFTSDDRVRVWRHGPSIPVPPHWQYI